MQMADQDKTPGQIAFDAWIAHRIGEATHEEELLWGNQLTEDRSIWEASASAVWDQAVEACISAICEDCAEGKPISYGYTHKRLTLTKDVYEVNCPAETIHLLKRSHQSQTGTDVLCQAKSSTQGETVSREGALQLDLVAEAEKRESQPAWMEARKIIHLLVLHCNGHVDHFGSHCSQCKEATAIVAGLIAANTQGQIDEPGTGDEMTAASDGVCLTPTINQESDNG
jgi:hypothetical protein